MKKLALFLTLICLTIATAVGQYTVTTDNPTLAACSEQPLFYTANPSTNLQGCSFQWKVIGGVIFGGATNGDTSLIVAGNTATITWNDTTKTGRIILIVSGCTLSVRNTSTLGQTFSIPVRSIIDRSPANIGGRGSIAIGIPVPAQEIYSVDRLAFPSRGSGDGNPLEAEVYEWELPPNWTIVSGQGTNSITVQPDFCSGGSMRVRAVDNCDPANPKFSLWSNPRNITRFVPQPGPITGPAFAVCKRTAPVTYSVPSVSGATSYTLSAS